MEDRSELLRAIERRENLHNAIAEIDEIFVPSLEFVIRALNRIQYGESGSVTVQNWRTGDEGLIVLFRYRDRYGDGDDGYLSKIAVPVELLLAYMTDRPSYDAQIEQLQEQENRQREARRKRADEEARATKIKQLEQLKKELGLPE